MKEHDGGRISASQTSPPLCRVQDTLCNWSAEKLCGFLQELAPHDASWQRLVDAIGKAANGDKRVQEFAAEIGLARGVTGYVYNRENGLGDGRVASGG